ncbi:MAG: response regulator [Bdellovibrio sp.]|nr:response regulator [Bdellovibrio sp.]
MSVKNILVIDDNKNDLLMAKFVIKRLGYNPILLENPKHVIDTLKAYPISLIVLDYEMPGMTGLDVLKKIKKEQVFNHIPVVMLTGNSTDTTVKNTVMVGAKDYIVKPIDPTIFETKISKIMKDNIQTEKNEWIEYEVQKNKNTEIKIYNYSSIISIGELTLTFHTNQDYPVGFTFFSDSKLFEELEIKNPALKVESSTQTHTGFAVQCLMLGLSEAELKKIRLYQKLLHSQKAS